MLVEDSADDVVLFEITLRRTGLHDFFELARRFENGEQAIEYFLNDSKTLEPEPLPDILILDVKLPGCSGFDVLERLQLLRSRLIIAMFTTSILPEDKQQAETLGADLFQTKTFEPAEFSRFLHFLSRVVDERAPKS